MAGVDSSLMMLGGRTPNPASHGTILPALIGTRVAVADQRTVVVLCAVTIPATHLCSDRFRVVFIPRV